MSLSCMFDPSTITHNQRKVLLPAARSGEVPPVWWVPAPVTGISQLSASSHRHWTGDPPSSFIYSPALESIRRLHHVPSHGGSSSVL